MLRSRITYSHFPGQGPAGKTCQGCRHWSRISDDTGWGRCAEAARKARLLLSQVQPAAADTRACRDWRERD
jgi:hypothetical protein